MRCRRFESDPGRQSYGPVAQQVEHETFHHLLSPFPHQVTPNSSFIMKLTSIAIAKHASVSAHLHTEVYRTYELRESGQKGYSEWSSACSAYHSHTSPLDIFWTKHFTKAVRNGNRPAIENLITFLQVDPIYNNSGYLKERLLRLIKNAPRSKSDDRRLLGVIWNRACGPDRREFKHYCRLATKITTPDFKKQVIHNSIQFGTEGWNKFKFLSQYL